MLIIPYWERKVGELGTQSHISGHVMSLRSAWPTRDPISTNKNHTTTKQAVAQAGQHSGVQGQLG